LLGVPWGRLADTGRSRGTFRERWVLRWEPEFAVSLVENLIHGPTIAEAASGRVSAEFAKARELRALADLVSTALTARIPEAVERGIRLLETRVAQTGDCAELLGALPPLANVVRYGEARRTDAVQLAALVARLLVQGAAALPYAARGLDQAAAASLRGVVLAADGAVALADAGGDEHTLWRAALRALTEDRHAAPLLAGTAARLLYEADALTPEAAALLLGRALSPGRAVAEAAFFFEGFFAGGGERLIHDKGLRDAVDHWLQSLDGGQFTEHLPLFRRAFANLDRVQRRRLLDTLFGRVGAGLPGRLPVPEAAAIWPRHFARLAALLTARPSLSEDRGE
jgi:hypothetical protein